MKKSLKQLVLTNFKGIKSLSIDFDPITTVISGENGTGKRLFMMHLTFCYLVKTVPIERILI